MLTASASAETAACAVLALLMSAVEPAPLATELNTPLPLVPVPPSAIPTLEGAAPRLTLKLLPASRKRRPSDVLPELTSLNAPRPTGCRPRLSTSQPSMLCEAIAGPATCASWRT